MKPAFMGRIHQLTGDETNSRQMESTSVEFATTDEEHVHCSLLSAFPRRRTGSFPFLHLNKSLKVPSRNLHNVYRTVDTGHPLPHFNPRKVSDPGAHPFIFLHRLPGATLSRGYFTTYFRTYTHFVHPQNLMCAEAIKAGSQVIVRVLDG